MVELLQINNVILNKVSRGEQSINLSLQRGEIHAVMGESGAGKTAIAYFLAGMQAQLSGTIFLNQQPINIKSPYDGISKGIGVLLDYSRYSQTPNFTVKEYLYLWTNKYVISGKKLVERTKKLFEEYELNINPDSLLTSLSQEEQCLISLMRVLARNPYVVVLDEPSQYIGEFRKQHLFRILRKFVEKNGGVLYLSNQLDEILQIGDRVTILKSGGTVASFQIDYARKKTSEILDLYFGRKKLEDDSSNNDEFKDVIDTILHTTELLTSEYELQDLLNLLVEKITDATKADACSILLFDEDSAKVVECFRHLRSTLPQVEFNEKVVHDVISSGELLIMENVSEAQMLELTGGKVVIKSLAYIPIPMRTKINGAIEVFYSQKKSFDQEDIELLKTFATQVAIAIENTRLLGRSTLLKEAHHRIKNNLQSIVSLLLLQLQSKNEKSLDAIIWEIIERIKTIASVHEILSKDEKSIGLINFRNLANIVVSNYNEKYYQNKIHIVMKISDIYVTYKTATSLGLILNELLSNCFEHAFTDGREGRIIISLQLDDKNIELKVIDNGVGFGLDASQLNTLGISLIKSLVKRDLRGTVEHKFTNGTTFTITFPKQQNKY